MSVENEYECQEVEAELSFEKESDEENILDTIEALKRLRAEKASNSEHNPRNRDL